MDPVAPFDAARRLLEQGIGFVKNTGMVVEHLAVGEVRCCMPSKGNGNHVGTMYAGALFTLAEMPGGALFLTSFDTARFYPVVKTFELQFLKPARGDIRVTARLEAAEISRIQREAEAQGKAEFDLALELKDAEGLVVATSAGRYQLRRHGP